MKKLYIKLFALLIFCILGTFANKPAIAQQQLTNPPIEHEEPHYSYSSAEVIGFSYFKLININPPIDDWIKLSPVYSQKKPAPRAQYILDERERLEFGYYGFQPKKHFIPVTVSIDYKIIPQEDGSGQLVASFPDMVNDVFPLSIGNTWIAIALDDIDINYSATIEPKDMDKLKAADAVQNNGIYKARLFLKALAAEKSEPLYVGDIRAWLMLTHLEGIIIEDPEQNIIWENGLIPAPESQEGQYISF